ncbi:lipase family protein [Streptomyces sp. NBC_00237]|uniref:lipase family protein n=1 Tax=Streptomyces sp. NBC_00237 TaxID=2975687 RepID=UPI002258D4CB|nr:lipase family protein [Streptomyces sp. NBC_00237]MCX5205216.1 lipase family protein [Streptomyces sp. NBC_00237]
MATRTASKDTDVRRKGKARRPERRHASGAAAPAVQEVQEAQGASGVPEVPAAPSGRTDPELLIAASVLLAEAALAAKQAGAEMTAAASSWRVGLNALKRPLWALGTVASTAKALTNPSGLGFIANGGLFGEAARSAAAVVRLRPTPVAMAVDAFALRIEAAAIEHPNLAAPLAKDLTDALVAGRRLDAIRAARRLVDLMGVTRALTTVSPVAMELFALIALLDENPGNDGFAWVTLAGGVPTTEPFLGLPAGLIRHLNPGPGRAERAEPDAILERCLTRSSNEIVSYIDDIAALGNHGLVLLRRIQCTDGSVRHVLLLPGTSFGLLRNSTTQDIVGAFDAALRTDTTYARAAKHLLLRAGVPVGSDLMVVGHSLGGITAMNLATDLDLVSTYRLTHIVTVGSPIDNKRPADPRTQVISLVNKYDVIPHLDGRGPSSPNDIPEQWVELAWLDDTYDYPLSHAPQSYSGTLRNAMPQHREHVNSLITDYDGEIVGNQPYLLLDR